MPARLTYLKINKFRHVKPGSVIEFKPGFNVVVGQNGAGKTTLLNLVSALLRNNFSEFTHEEFSLQYQMVDGSVTLRGMLENTVTNGRGLFTYLGELTYSDVSIRIESNDFEALFTVNERQEKIASVTPVKSPDDVSVSPIALILTTINNATTDAHVAAYAHLQSGPQNVLFPPCGGPTRLTEGASTFDELFASEIFSALGVSILQTDEGAKILAYNLPPAVFSAETLGTPETSDTITLGCDMMSLTQFVRLSQYEDARLILLKITAANTKKETTWRFGRPLARFQTSNGNEVPHNHLSFGEKRLFAFLLKLYAHPPTIVVDELANGMHHSWLEHCIELLDELGTQSFLTSQNPLLLDCIPLTRETYATSHTLVICELTESGEMVWRNLSDAETEDFFKSLDVGLQHVSEIMRAKGLW